MIIIKIYNNNDSKNSIKNINNKYNRCINNL